MRRESRTGVGQEYRIIQIRNISEDGHLLLKNPSIDKLPNCPKSSFWFGEKF